MTTPAPPLTAPPVSAVSVKLPTFYGSDPELWFTQVEAQFQSRKIVAQDTKYWYVVAGLSQETAAEIRDLLVSPPTSNQYDVLKTTILKRFASSAQERVQQLLQKTTLGDTKPSALLRKMQHLAGTSSGSLPKDIFKQIFLSRLPTEVQQVLAACPNQDVDELAQIADRIIEIPSVSATTINAISDNYVKYSEFANLKADVQSLSVKIDKLCATVNNLHVDRQRARSRSRSVSATTSDNTGLCYYHKRFAQNATKCQQPCNYSSKGN